VGLALDGVDKEYAGGVFALRGVAVEIAAGDQVAVVGPSGSGKTTMLTIMGTLERATSGRVEVAGHDVVAATDRELAGLRARGIGFVFQGFHLQEAMTALDNVALGMLYGGQPLRERRVLARAALERVGLEHRLEHKPVQLSGGERQRVAIGRALVREPKAYLMDEPISALDARLREEMRVELNRLQRQFKHTFVHVTHDQEEAMAVADRLCVMNDGQIEQIGTPQELYNAPHNRYVARQLGAPPVNLISGNFDAASGLFEASAMPLAAVAVKSNAGHGAAWLGVRPEDLGIAATAAGAGSVRAEIYEVEPLGAITIVDVKVGEQILKAQLPGQPTFSEGEPVYLCFDLAKCHLFDSGSGRRLATGLTAVARN
jgi:multiple sugar transport system ATP-binding protein